MESQLVFLVSTAPNTGRSNSALYFPKCVVGKVNWFENYPPFRLTGRHAPVQMFLYLFILKMTHLRLGSGKNEFPKF